MMALPTNVGLVWKSLSEKNALAYRARLKVVKRDKVQLWH